MEIKRNNKTYKNERKRKKQVNLRKIVYLSICTWTSSPEWILSIRCNLIFLSISLCVFVFGLNIFFYGNWMLKSCHTHIFLVSIRFRKVDHIIHFNVNQNGNRIFVFHYSLNFAFYATAQFSSTTNSMNILSGIARFDFHRKKNNNTCKSKTQDKQMLQFHAISVELFEK